MICRYSLVVHCACPLDEGKDTYLVEVESHDMVKVEDIIDAVREYDTKPAYQEDLTGSLARLLGCRVTTTGYHSGVLTEVTAP